MRLALLLLLFLFACQQPQPAPESPASGMVDTTSPQPGPLTSGSASPAPQSNASTIPGVVGGLQADVQLDKEVYAPGEEIKVTVIAMGLSESAWVRQVDSENDLVEMQVTGTSSSVTLTAEGPPGTYKVQLYSSRDENKPSATRAFQVK